MLLFFLFVCFFLLIRIYKIEIDFGGCCFSWCDSDTDLDWSGELGEVSYSEL